MDDRELSALAKEQQIDRTTLLHERREVQFLAGMADDPILGTHLAFKGGTALRLIYLCDRYSDDLDFDLVRHEEDAATLLKRLASVATKQNLEVTDAWVKRGTILLEVRESGWKRKLKIEVSSLPRDARIPTTVKNIVSPVFPQSVNVLTYGLPVLLSGKMLAVLKRSPATPRDLYDLWWLLSRAVKEESAYLIAASFTAHRRELHRSLLKRIDAYDDRQIQTELGALLPAGRRAWVREHLKERTKELLTLRLAEGES